MKIKYQTSNTRIHSTTNISYSSMKQICTVGKMLCKMDEKFVCEKKKITLKERTKIEQEE